VDLCSSTHSCIKKKKKEKAKQKPAKDREKGETKENGTKVWTNSIVAYISATISIRDTRTKL
jgi:hypothetical protein